MSFVRRIQSTSNDKDSDNDYDDDSDKKKETPLCYWHESFAIVIVSS